MDTPAIIFDLDGTLWDSSDAILPSWQEVIKRHNLSRGPVTKEEMSTYMGLTNDEIAKKMFYELPFSSALSLMEEGTTAECLYLTENGALLYPDVITTLKKLFKSYKLFIVSNSGDGYVQAFLEHYKLWDIISDFEMAGRTGMKKGENILLIMERNNIKKAAYIGDTAHDESAARFACVPFVYCSYGFGKGENPAATIKSFSELPEVIKNIL